MSLTVLSSVGSGDIVPLSAQARVLVLVMLEQFAGVDYIATVVSRSIALTVLRERKRDRERRREKTSSGWTRSRCRCVVSALTDPAFRSACAAADVRFAQKFGLSGSAL